MREIKYQAWATDIMVQVVKLDFMKNTKGEYAYESSGYFVSGYNKGQHTEFKLNEVKLREFTGLKDKNGVEIYEGDILEVTYLSWRRYKVAVKLGQYKQDGSAGEYEGSDCIGFYAEAIDKEALDEDGDIIVRDYMHTASILDYEDIEVIGNVFKHPHLLEVSTE